VSVIYYVVSADVGLNGHVVVAAFTTRSAAEACLAAASPITRWTGYSGHEITEVEVDPDARWQAEP